MKAASIVFPRPFEVDITEKEVREPAGQEVLVEAVTSLVSPGTELRCLLGQFDGGTNWSSWVHYPFAPGYCVAGLVAEPGRDAKQFKKGDRVVTMWPHEKLFVDKAENLIPVPDNVSWEEAAWQPLGVITQIGARRAGIGLGDRVGIIGAGAMGQLVLQYVRLRGARTIVVIDPVKARLEVAERHGANACLALTAQEAVAEVRALTAGRMLDIVFDVTGLPTVLSAASQMLRRMGTIVLVGDTTTPSKQFLGPNVLSDSISILGSHGSLCPSVSTEFNPWTWKEMAALFFELLVDRRLDVRSLTTSCVSPREAQKVYGALRESPSGQIGVVFDWRLI